MVPSCQRNDVLLQGSYLLAPRVFKMCVQAASEPGFVCVGVVSKADKTSDHMWNHSNERLSTNKVT